MRKIIIVLFLLWVLLVPTIRLSHIGRVCSGEYLTTSPYLVPSATYVDFVAGIVLLYISKIIAIVTVTILALILIFSALWYRRTSERVKFGKGIESSP